MEKRTNIRYTVEEALQYILEPASDSEISDLESEDEVSVLENISIGNNSPNADVDEVCSEDDLSEDHKASTSKSSKHIQEKPKKRLAADFVWTSALSPPFDSSFHGEEFSLPPHNFDMLTPIHYFQLFWDGDITKNLVEQTNIYSVQSAGKSILATQKEIEKLIGIQMKMSFFSLPQYHLYWSSEMRCSAVADIMSKNRYKQLRKYLHANDNTLQKDGDRLHKVRPVLDGVRNNCVKVEAEVEHSVDEQIIPAKTKYSGIRQYNPKKPVKWGFKNFVRAGKSGIIYDFFMYTGASTSDQNCNGYYVVTRLCDTLPKNKNYRVFFDNWFTSYDLCTDLKSYGILTTATLRVDRMLKCPLMSEKELKKKGRGSSSFKTDKNSGITVLRWLDNKSVQLVSTYASPEAISTVKRWDRKGKKYIDVPCPDMVKDYNQAMGGVDLADMLIELYRTKIKTNRWYIKLIFHCVDIAKVNAWLLYRRHADQLKINKKKQYTLLKFVMEISDVLVKEDDLIQSNARGRGRPSQVSLERVETELMASKRRKMSIPTPCNDIRLDNNSHWPEFKDGKNKCRLCKVATSRVCCMKCKVFLCMNNSRNCFLDFHTKR